MPSQDGISRFCTNPVNGLHALFPKCDATAGSSDPTSEPYDPELRPRGPPFRRRPGGRPRCGRWRRPHVARAHTGSIAVSSASHGASRRRPPEELMTTPAHRLGGDDNSQDERRLWGQRAPSHGQRRRNDSRSPLTGAGHQAAGRVTTYDTVSCIFTCRVWILNMFHVVTSRSIKLSF